MAEQERLPLRVLVKGPSTAIALSWMGGPRSEFTWPRVIEAELYAAGFPAEVRNTAMAAEPTRFAIRSWQEEVLAWSPDVIILHYGQFECVHLFVPHWLERHANSNLARPGPVRSAYRRRLVRPLWQCVAKLQAVVDGKLPPNLLSFKRRRVAADLRRVIERMRTVGSPLILIPDNSPPGARYRRWFPGMGARTVAMNETVRALVASFDEPDIRMFELNATIEPLLDEGEDCSPDGGHLTPALHRAVGEAMAEVIVRWAADQKHLDLDGYRLSHGDPDHGRLSPTAD